jgi:glutaredoxin-dependent peroxiredoxin
LSEFRDKAGQIYALGAHILGISVESDRAHRAFAEHLGLDFPLVSDFNREVVGQYGIQYLEPYNGMRGMSRRSVFVVAQDGTIRYAWVTDDPLIAPNVDEVIGALETLRAEGGA